MMKRPALILIPLIMLLFVSFTVQAEDGHPQKLNLMPVPQRVEQTGGKFRLTNTFKMSVRGNPDKRIYIYASNVLRRLDGRTGLFLPQDFITVASDTVQAAMVIRVARPGKVQLHEDESYRLRIGQESILLEAETDIGALRGLETLLQLLSTDKQGYYFPTVEIDDKPRFPWRGLLIDVSRHFMPIGVLKRNIDAMAAMKMNVMHWHLVDDQGFRAESKTFPKLHLLGSDGYYYTQEQIKDIIAYADVRGIRVLPEFDIPAHATSWLVGYPELGSAPGPYTIERHWGIFDPTIDPTRDSTYEFMDRFFAEMAALFPDEYMHIGGDENKGKHWDNNPDIQAFMKANNIPDNHALQTYFNRRILAILTKHGKKMIGWDEIFHPDLPNNVIIHSWRGHKTLMEAARKGYQSVLSRDYYIDLMKTAEFHYLNDPIPEDSLLTDEQKGNILGGEGTSWGELVTWETLDSRIWPRTAAIAERLWSAQSVRDVEDMYRRLEIISFRLEELGVDHIKNYEMMLRRLANGYEIDALKTFVDVLEPVKDYQRHFQGVKYTSYSPLTRVVDAARPESMTAREFNQVAERFSQNKSKEDFAKLTLWLVSWRDNHAALLPVIKNSPILWEMESLSADLKDLALIGLEALDLMMKKKKPTKAWEGQCREVLERAKKPRGQAELMVVKGIEKLIQSICGEK
mgnify:CR=1 FL=1